MSNYLIIKNRVRSEQITIIFKKNIVFFENNNKIRVSLNNYTTITLP